jgi:anti-anti-sigma factor
MHRHSEAPVYEGHMTAPQPHGATPDVELEIHEHVGTAIVTLRGEHDISTQPSVSAALTRASRHANVLVDLSACTFADSSLITALIAANIEIKRREGRIEVVVPPEASAVRQVVELTRLCEIIPLRPSRTGARPRSGGGAA